MLSRTVLRSLLDQSLAAHSVATTSQKLAESVRPIDVKNAERSSKRLQSTAWADVTMQRLMADAVMVERMRVFKAMVL